LLAQQCQGCHSSPTSPMGGLRVDSRESILKGGARGPAIVPGKPTESLLLRAVRQTEALRMPPSGKLKDAEKEIEKFRAEKVLQAAAGLVESAEDVRGIAVVTGQVPDGTTPDDLRKLVLDVRGRLGSRPAVVAVAAASGERPVVVIATNEGSRELGLKAGELVRSAAKTLGGGGGGKDDVAQGGGTDNSAIPAALEEITRGVAAKVAA